jgi:hypothetical protein
MLGGCGGGGQPTTAEVPLHGGTIVALPGNRGFAEILNEVKPEARSSTVVVYFVQPDMKSPLSPAPSDVRLKIQLGRKDSIVRLAPDPATGDPLAAARFASPPGNYPWEARENELIATIDGQSVTVPFRPPR